ncbi:nucleotidyltransferase family protein [Shewanella avicenniae]|uniref:Nucleotidyltransferase family protein n=1 Tax=Shewanella avicenniae TaxID=2814294 RepID=A0ABX7QW45_9GAMM|nr:nucleotidyltransferase family protein [Shewanella avicenniae]QSX34853.1 nucleotidyltransferase family protein [Shewanella avicenniae]
MLELPITDVDHWRQFVAQQSRAQLQQLLFDWLRQDQLRMGALNALAALNLPNCYIAAGFVRHLVWDRLHGLEMPLNDVDVIYFDPDDCSRAVERTYEQRLAALIPLNWSVKNQARMHLKHGHRPYHSVSDAMSYWPELETAIAVSLHQGQLQLLDNCCLHSLMSLYLSPNPLANAESFQLRISSKGWLTHYQYLMLGK